MNYARIHRSLPSSPIWLALLVVGVSCSFLLPMQVEAHSAGTIDVYGCHTDRRKGGYHCHRGRFSGLKFSSKGDFLKKRAAGYTGEDQRTEEKKPGLLDSIFYPEDGELTKVQGSREKREQSDASRNTEVGTVETADSTATTSAASSIEERLKRLKNLHSEGLISDDEYSAKKEEILDGL